MKIALVSPFPPAVGGMAVLANSLQLSLESQGIKVIPINTHPQVKHLINLEKIIQFQQLIVFIFNLRKTFHCNAALIISSSGDFFHVKAFSALCICKLFRCRAILDFVGGGILEFSPNEKLRILKKLRKFDHVIAPSSPFLEIFKPLEKKCTLFPHIVEIERFEGRKHPLAKPVFLSAKNHEEYSNIGSIIRAFKLVKEQFPNACLVITGRGSLTASLKSLTKEIDVSDVDFMENLSNEEMPGVFKRATIFLHATRIESFGIVIIEALASGTPVISTNAGGIPDIIKDGKNGFLIDYNDHKKMADRAIELLNNKLIYDQFVEEGRETAQQYSSASLGPKLKELIINVLNDR